MTTFILLGMTSKSVQVTFREGFSSCYARAAISSFFMHFRCPYRSKYTFAELFDKSKKTGFSENYERKFDIFIFKFISLERTLEARYFELLFGRIGSRSSENETKEVFKLVILEHGAVPSLKFAINEYFRFRIFFCFVLRAP